MGVAGELWPLESRVCSGSMPYMDTHIFVNDTLARGLRKQMLDQTAAAVTRADQRISKWSVGRAQNRTKKGWRRAHAEIDQAFGNIALMRTVADGQLASWIMLDGVSKLKDGGSLLQSHPWLKHLDGAFIFSGLLVDLFRMQARYRSIPILVRSHAVDRMFQRLATTDAKNVIAELLDVPMMAAISACETILSHEEGLLDQNDRPPMPIAFATKNGMLLGDIIPASRQHEAFIELNTFIGGERDITGAKALLRKKLATWRDRHGQVMARIAISLTLMRYTELRGTPEFEQARQAYAELIELMESFAGVIRPRTERNSELVRKEMAWRWARAQANGTSAVMLAAPVEA